jgi:hypothetical protein
MPQLDEDGRCVLSGLFPDQCGHCTGAEDREREDREKPEAPERWIVAKYASECRDCHGEIEAGDLICRSADNRGWIGECCG